MKKEYIIPTAKFTSIDEQAIICFSIHPEPGDGEQLANEQVIDDFEEDDFTPKTVWDD